LAKGHMVREIDVMGGEMGLAADATCIQFKRLNSRKGPAVRGSRVQSDKHLYSQYMTSKLLNQPNLTVKQAEVKRLILDGDRCVARRLGNFLASDRDHHRNIHERRDACGTDSNGRRPSRRSSFDRSFRSASRIWFHRSAFENGNAGAFA